MFADKARSLTKSGVSENAPLCKALASLANIRLGWKTWRGKHSSLLRTFVNYDHKKFYNIGPWLQKYFFSGVIW